MQTSIFIIVNKVAANHHLKDFYASSCVCSFICYNINYLGFYLALSDFFSTNSINPIIRYFLNRIDCHHKYDM